MNSYKSDAYIVFSLLCFSHTQVLQVDHLLLAL